MTIHIFLLCYLIAAFAAAALADFIYRAIGAPYIDDNGRATCSKGMILSRYGLFICDMYNKRQQRRQEVLRRKTDALTFSDAEIEWATAKTFFQSEDGQAERAIQFLRDTELEKLIRNDTAVNWYKSLGVCKFCTSFWICSLAGAVLLFALSLSYPISLTAWILSLAHFAPVAIKIGSFLD